MQLFAIHKRLDSPPLETAVMFRPKSGRFPRADRPTFLAENGPRAGVEFLVAHCADGSLTTHPSASNLGCVSAAGRFALRAAFWVETGVFKHWAKRSHAEARSRRGLSPIFYSASPRLCVRQTANNHPRCGNTKKAKVTDFCGHDFRERLVFQGQWN